MTKKIYLKLANGISVLFFREVEIPDGGACVLVLDPGRCNVVAIQIEPPFKDLTMVSAIRVDGRNQLVSPVPVDLFYTPCESDLTLETIDSTIEIELSNGIR